jgi:hypothetical protein
MLTDASPDFRGFQILEGPGTTILFDLALELLNNGSTPSNQTSRMLRFKAKGVQKPTPFTVNVFVEKIIKDGNRYLFYGTSRNKRTQVIYSLKRTTTGNYGSIISSDT